jgi:hypothetical protein
MSWSPIISHHTVYEKETLGFTVVYSMFVSKVPRMGIFGIGDLIAGNMALIDKESITTIWALSLVHGRILACYTCRPVQDADCAVYDTDRVRVCARLFRLSWPEL